MSVFVENDITVLLEELSNHSKDILLRALLIQILPLLSAEEYETFQKDMEKLK